MGSWLQRLFGRHRSPQPAYDEDLDVTQFYTDTERALQVFEQLLTVTSLAKPFLVIHGLGGVGKSTLLWMYRLSALRHQIPIALVASEEAASSPVKVLATWADQLSRHGVTLPIFQKALTEYRAIQAKVETEAQRRHQALAQLPDTLGKAVVKSSIGVAASAIPLVGPVVSAVGGAIAEASIDWLHGFLSKPELELYMDPRGRLDDDFLRDLTKGAARQRLVLMVDTYEQMTTQEDWMRKVAQRLPKNVLLVIAGRRMPAWEREWSSWLRKAELVELEEMTPEYLRTLVQRYYAFIHGGEPDPQQVEAVVRFARGLPLVATTVVQLWVKYPASYREDFEAVRPQVVADLVDQLLKGVPQEMRPAFEAAAVLRYFNADALGALLESGDAEALYAELRRWPFIRSRQGGRAVHDTMREMINEVLQVRTPERFRTLHLRAANYFENRVKQLNAILGINEECQQLALEEVYHLLQVNEEAGFDLLHAVFGQGLVYFRYQFCRTLLSDAEALKLHSPKSIHRLKYYQCRLTVAEFSWAYLKGEELQELATNSHRDPDIEWEVFFSYAEFLSFTAQASKASEYYQKSLEALQAIGKEETAAGCLVLAVLANRPRVSPMLRRQWAARALKISQKIDDPYNLYTARVELGHTYFAEGDFSTAEDLWRQALSTARKSQNDERTADAYNRLAQAQMALGQLAEAERSLILALEAAKRLPDTLGAGRDKEMYIKPTGCATRLQQVNDSVWEGFTSKFFRIALLLVIP